MRRPGAGLAVSVVGAVLLALSLFAPWYGVPAELGGASVSAWRAFHGIDVLLFACAFLGGGLAAAIARDAADRTMAPAIHAIGAVAGALVLYRIAVQPEPAQLIDLRWGPFVALAAVGLLAVGPWVEGRGRIR